MHELDRLCSWKVTGLLGSSEQVLARLFTLRLFGLRCLICLARILAYLFQTSKPLHAVLSQTCVSLDFMFTWTCGWPFCQRHFGSSLWDSNPTGFSIFHLHPTIHLFGYKEVLSAFRIWPFVSLLKFLSCDIFRINPFWAWETPHSTILVVTRWFYKVFLRHHLLVYDFVYRCIARLTHIFASKVWCELIKHVPHLVSYTPHVKISLFELMNNFCPVCAISHHGVYGSVGYTSSLSLVVLDQPQTWATEERSVNRRVYCAEQQETLPTTPMQQKSTSNTTK